MYEVQAAYLGSICIPRSIHARTIYFFLAGLLAFLHQKEDGGVDRRRKKTAGHLEKFRRCLKGEAACCAVGFISGTKRPPNRGRRILHPWWGRAWFEETGLVKPGYPHQNDLCFLYQVEAS